MGRGAVERSIGAGKDRLIGAAALAIPEVVGSDIAADADTSVGARDVVESVTIETADLHVLDRLGLDGKIGCLRPSHRNHTRCGAKEKTLHHVHLLLQQVVLLHSGGSRRASFELPPKLPSYPLAARSPDHLSASCLLANSTR